MLILPIKKKWFDMIVSGEKKEEYREIKPYWTSRLKHHLKSTIIDGFKLYRTGYVIFRNGYSNSSPAIKCHILCHIGFGKEKRGAKKNQLYYVLEISSVEEL